MIVRAIEGERPGRRDLALRVPGRGRVHPRSRPIPIGSTGRRPAWSASSCATGSARMRRCCGGTVRNHVHVADGDGGIRKRLREQIRRNERRGWSVRPRPPGREADAGARRAFERAYAETMARTGRRSATSIRASTSSACSAASGAGSSSRPGTESGLAGAIAVASDGYLHYYLGGTADEALRGLADEEPVRGDDRAWDRARPPASTSAAAWHPATRSTTSSAASPMARRRSHTHELICDPAAYERLAAQAGRPPEGFFPAYRS